MGQLKTKLMTININEIEIGSRFRKEYKNIDSLKEDIQKNGLISPVAVIQDDDYFLLAAGGRRMQACAALGIEEIPCNVYLNCTEADLRSIELAENIQREDLTWEEEAALTKELYDLKVAEHGAKIAPSQKDGWSHQDTADMLGKSRGLISQDLELATVLEENPEIFKGCKSKSDAKKVLVKTKEQILNKQLAQIAKTKIREDGEETTKAKLIDSYNIGSFFDGVKDIKDNSIDLIEMDPPYNLGLKYSIKMTEQQHKDLLSPPLVTAEQYVAFLQESITECYRTLKVGGWFILWHPMEMKKEGDPIHVIIWDILQKVGFNPRPIRAQWIKIDEKGNASFGAASTRDPNTILGNSYEMFYYCSKGTGKLQKPGSNNIFPFKAIPGPEKVHPTERPIELIEEILKTFIPHGSSIMVPFAGSGNTLLAANNLLMKAIGWDVSDKYIDSYIKKIYEDKKRSV